MSELKRRFPDARRARKDHSCSLCATPILAGCYYIFGNCVPWYGSKWWSDDGFSTLHMHIDCYQTWRAADWIDCNEGLWDDCGEWWRAVHEYEDEPRFEALLPGLRITPRFLHHPAGGCYYCHPRNPRRRLLEVSGR